MKLYLMQHGKPVPKEEDPERPLSSKGIDEINKMAEFLKKRGIRVDKIFHSGKTRAMQTAEIMISMLSPDKKPMERKGLSPMDDVKYFVEQIREVEEDIMIVGHLPHLAKLTSFLVAGSESVSIVAFQQGGLVCLSRDNDLHWHISWMLVPEII